MTTTSPPPTASARPPATGGVLDPVRRHPLVSFFVLANVMSWLAWTPYVLSRNGLGIWDYRFPDVLGTRSSGCCRGPTSARSPPPS